MTDARHAGYYGRGNIGINRFIHYFSRDVVTVTTFAANVAEGKNISALHDVAVLKNPCQLESMLLVVHRRA